MSGQLQSSHGTPLFPQYKFAEPRASVNAGDLLYNEIFFLHFVVVAAAAAVTAGSAAVVSLL